MMDYQRTRRRRSYDSKLILYSKLTKYLFFAFIGAVIFGIGMFLWFSKDLPTPGKLKQENFSQSTKIYDRNGIVLYDIFQDENRTYVALPEISKNAQYATIAIEDKDFYKNQGFSILGYLRAFRNLLLAGRVSGGGSTLTQQLVKNTLLTSEQTLPRKIKELILSLQVDKRYSKDQILELYLNVTPYGGTNVGIEAAAEGYFGKKAKDLSLVESAVLAGLPQRPSYYSPYGSNPKAYIGRATDVLRRMREDGYITKQQEADAVKKLPSVTFLTKHETIKAPHFAFYVKKLLEDKFGPNAVEQGGLRVITTLDYKLQEKAEGIVKEEVEKAKSLKVGNGASLVMDPKNGEILAMIGSKDFFATDSSEGQFNVVTQSLRQPGSSIKPVTYATALSQGYTPATLLMDTKTTFANPGATDYIPVNYDGKYHGPIQMRFALGSSLNVPAVKMLALVGIKNMLATANNMGLTTFAPTDENMKRFGLALTLGGGEVHLIDLATAYCAFANGGHKVEPVAILKVSDSKGKVLYEYKSPQEGKQVISPEVAFLVSHMLLDNNARLLTFGQNSYLNTGRNIAVKTGTTDDKRDNWTIGWTPTVLVATWVGNNDNSPMGNVASGVTGAAPIWRRIILESLKGKPAEDFKKPDNVIALTIDAFGGGAPVEGQPTRSEYFIKGTEPQGPAAIYKQVKISKADSNKLANDQEVEKNDYDLKKYVVFTENDPVSSDGKNRWQEGIDLWLVDYRKDDQLYHPPTEKSGKTYGPEESKPTNTPTPTPTP